MQMRIQQTGEIVEILCVCFDFHTSNIQRARTERLAQYIVRSGNPILRSPEGRSLTAGVTIIRTTERHAFSRVSAIERVQRLFFAYFFLARQKKVCPRSDSCGVTAKMAPPVNPEKSLPHPPDAVHPRTPCAVLCPPCIKAPRVLRARLAPSRAQKRRHPIRGDEILSSGRTQNPLRSRKRRSACTICCKAGRFCVKKSR